MTDIHNRALIIRELKSLLQIQTAPLVLTGQIRGKSISQNCLARAVVGSDAIHNQHINNIIGEQYKVCLLIDASGSRGGDSRVLSQAIQMYYYIAESIGKNNVKLYFFNMAIIEATQALGAKPFSYKTYGEFVADEAFKPTLAKFSAWVNTAIGPPGREFPYYAGNHDGYAVKTVSSLPWWSGITKPKRLLIHLSDGLPNCDRAPCGLPGCGTREEISKDWEETVACLIRDHWTLCGIGVSGRDLQHWYGRANCFTTSEDTEEMVNKFVQFFKGKIKVKKVAI